MTSHLRAHSPLAYSRSRREIHSLDRFLRTRVRRKPFDNYELATRVRQLRDDCSPTIQQHRFWGHLLTESSVLITTLNGSTLHWWTRSPVSRISHLRKLISFKGERFFCSRNRHAKNRGSSLDVNDEFNRCSSLILERWVPSFDRWYSHSCSSLKQR